MKFMVGYTGDSPQPRPRGCEADPYPRPIVPCLELVQLNHDAHTVGGVLSKPMMLRSLLTSLSKHPPTFVLFVDCDVVFPQDFSERIVSTTAPYQVADRVDLDPAQTLEFMEGGEVTGSLPDINKKKRGMGWFQLVRWEALSYVTRNYRWNEPGYDVFDWTLNRDLSATTSQHLVPCSPFLHLWHGEPGSTWKGTDTDL